MMRGMKLLARMKGLRGTWLDPFGRTAERRMERKLIADYEAMIRDITSRLSESNQRFAVSLAKLPDEIRGFGPVKESAIQRAESARADLMRQFEGSRKAAKTSTENVSEPAE